MYKCVLCRMGEGTYDGDLDGALELEEDKVLLQEILVMEQP